ncbi:right-handed parallel beta-helix repeat-containing protein, partial [Planctomycetota bacterium]
EYINIRGFTFCDTDYILPKEGIPPIRDPGDIWFPSAITLKGVSNCVFEDNTVRNTGTYGVDLTGDGNQIIGNKIYDTGSGGVITRSYGRNSNMISYNHIHHCGLVFHAGVGINIDDGGGLIANNLIHHISHSGVYVRHHTTDYGQGPERSNQEQGLIIEYNEIYDVMLGSNDGGGIFVRDHYIAIRNNFIHDSRVTGIYLGCETRDCLVENNVLCRTGPGQVVWFLNKNVTIFNNIYIDGNPPIWYTNYGGGHHQNIKFMRNIIFLSDPDGVLINADEESLPLESDYNVIYHTTGEDLVVNGLPGVETFEDWQNLGYDTHSIVTDPLFVDPENDDYSLRPDSPALKMGFKPIDLSGVGLRSRKLK